MALARVTGADAEQRLKTVTQRNQQFATSVRKAIGVAETLSKAQAAARSLPALASGMSTQLGSVSAAPPETGAGNKFAVVNICGHAAPLPHRYGLSAALSELS